MSKIPEAVIEAASTHYADADTPRIELSNAARARRVFLALAENLPDSAVEEALSTFYRSENTNHGSMQESIAAFLKHVAGETP